MRSKVKRTVFLVAAGVLILTAAASTFFLLAGDEDPAKLLETGTVLKIGVECDFPPYNWEENLASETNLPLVNREGFYAEGFDVQIIRLIAEQLEAKVEIQKIAWGDLLPALKEGQIDMIISGMADNKERVSLPDFSHSRNYTAHAAEYCVMVRKGSRFAESSTLADFYNARIQGQKGTRFDAVIDQIPGVRHLPPVEIIPHMFGNLISGAADGVVIGIESTQEYLREFPSLVVIRFSRGNGFYLDFTGACAWVRRGNDHLLRAVNWAISKIPVETRLELMKKMETKNDA